MAFQALAETWDCVFTRYADDLAFSGKRKFTADDVGQVQALLGDGPFELHPGKTRICGPGVRQMVAGLVVNQAGMPPRGVRRRWRAMFHRASRFPHEFVGRGDQLMGVAAFVGEYSPDKAAEYLGIATEVRILESAGGAL